MGEGLFPDEASIYIVSADTDGSELTNDDLVTGEVSNYSETGGDKETSSIPVFGGGNVDKEDPRGQIEVSFDIEMQYTTPYGVATKWDAFKYGSGLTSATSGAKQAIFIQWTDGTNFYTRAYNNASAVSWNPTSAADGNLKGTISFKLSPTTANASANLKIASTAASTISW